MNVSDEEKEKLEIQRFAASKPVNESLAKRVLRSVLGIYLSIAVSITILQLYLEYKNEKNRLVSEINQVAKTFQPIVSQAIWNLDESQIATALDGVLLTNRDVRGVEVLDADGNMTHSNYASADSENGQNKQKEENPELTGEEGAESESAAAASAVEKEGLAQASTAKNSNSENNIALVEKFNFTYDLLYSTEFTGEQNLGSLVLVTNSNVVLKRAALTFYITFVSAFLKTTILWIIFYIMVTRMVGRPMYVLAHAMERLNPSSHPGEKDEQDEVIIEDSLLERPDELGKTLRTFQAMKTSLQHKDRALKEYHSHLEEKVEERTAQLERASQAKSDFLASMSHEIRTPMNGVLGMVQLLADTPLNEKQLKYIKIIQNSGESLIDIINGILEHLKIEANKIDLERVPISLGDIIDECSGTFSYRSRETKVALIPLFCYSCPQWVLGDPTRIKQILNNLVGNAFKFTHDGEIVIKVNKVDDLEQQKVLIRITVTDTGIGIPEEKVAKLFTPFSQADNSTTRKYGGTGLGLSISKQLAEIMGGTIAIESEEGKGSTFIVDLPFEPCDAPPDKADEDEKATAILGDKRILIVDDHEAFRALTSEVLLNWRVKSTTTILASSARKEIEKSYANEEPFDIAIVDARLPDTPGMSLAKEWLSKYGSKKPKVMLVSAFKEIQNHTPLHESGIEIFVEKPVANSELRDTLVSLLTGDDATNLIKAAPKNEEDFSVLKVLVAEDNLVNQMVIRGLLNKVGIEPEVVENGFKAIDACKNDGGEAFDLILMDCEMPELNGWEASKQIRALNYLREDGSKIEIYALSAHAMEKHMEKAVESGMDGYIYKPISIGKLTDLLRDILDDE